MKVVEVLQRGALTTIQDMGRYGYQQYGVSISGAMDKFALKIANLLVGNQDNDAVLEITLIGPKLKFIQDLKIALTGANLQPLLNGLDIDMWKTVDVKCGDILSFGRPIDGCRAYMALCGGIDIPVMMESRSTHVLANLEGFGRSLVKGDAICVKTMGNNRLSVKPNFRLSSEQIPEYKSKWFVRVIPGPQIDYFSTRGITTLFESEYEVTSQSNRMAYRLTGPRIEHQKGSEIITDATPPGSIQVPGNGMPIILLADTQPSGGYPKIGVVVTKDQDCFAQAKPGDKVSFERIKIAEAHKIYFEEEVKMKQIKKEVLLSDGRF